MKRISAILLPLLLLTAVTLRSQQPRPFYELPSVESSREEERDEYDPSRNPLWSGITPEGYLHAWERMVSMPSEDEVEADSRGKVGERSLLSERTWRPIGPKRVRLRHTTQIYWHGRIRNIQWYYTPGTGAKQLYVGSSSGGYFNRWRRSAGPGYIWHFRQLGAKLPNPSIGALLIHPANPNVVFVGTGDWARYGGAGLFKTTDGGESWARIPLRDAIGQDIIPGSITSMFFDVVATSRGYFTDTSTIYLSSDRGVFKSTDRGATWLQKGIIGTNPNWGVYEMVHSFRDPGLLYAALPGGGGIYKSINGGDNWTPVNSTLPLSNCGSTISLAIGPSDPSLLYCAFTDTNNNVGGVFKTTNAGGRWDAVTGSLRNYMNNGQGGDKNVIEISPYDSRIVYAGSVGLIRTTNGGADWSDVDGAHSDYTVITFDPDSSNIIYIGSDGGFFVRNERTGIVSNNEYDFPSNSPLQSYGMDYAWSNSSFVVSGTQDNGSERLISLNYNTTDGIVGDWENFSGCDGADNIAIHPTDPQLFYFNLWCGGGGLRNRSPNGGITEEYISNGVPEIWMTPIQVNKLNTNNPFTVDTAWLYYSTNRGDNWRRATAGAARDFGRWEPPRRIAMNTGAGAPVTAYVTFWRPRDLPAGTPDPSRQIRIIEGTPGSMTMRTSSLPGNRSIREVITDRWDAARAYAFTDDNNNHHIYLTTDRGGSWTPITGDLPITINHMDIARHPGNSLIMYASTDLGVFKTRTGGTTWYPFQNGLPIVGVNRMAYIPSVTGDNRFDTLRISTYGRGFWDRVLQSDDPIWLDITAVLTRFNDSLFRRLTFRNIATAVNNGSNSRRSDTMIAVADGGLVARTFSGGRSWDTSFISTQGSLYATAASDCTSFTAVGQYGWIMQTRDLGTTWLPVNSPTNVDLRTVQFIDSLNGWIGGDNATILMTEDGGTSWSQVQNTWKPNDQILSLHFLDKFTGLVSGISTSTKPPTPFFRRTTDGGSSWIDDGSLANVVIEKIEMYDNLTGYAVGENGAVARTDDGGKTWNFLNSGVQNRLYGASFIKPGAGWVYGSGGLILHTSDGGKSWEQEETESDVDLVSLAQGNSALVAVGDSVVLIHELDQTLPPYTGGRLFGDSLPPNNGFDSTTSDVTSPSVGALAHIRSVPNPFTQTTTLYFRVPHPTHVDIDIFDMLGEEVRSLVHSECEAGEYSATWDGSLAGGGRLPGGVYLCRMTAGGTSVVTHIVMAR